MEIRGMRREDGARKARNEPNAGREGRRIERKTKFSPNTQKGGEGMERPYEVREFGS
jgi:hypothetical protein